MVNLLEIKNFRCFEHVTLRDMPLFNVVVGKNGSGKTTLLEALFLAEGRGPEVALRFRSWRGMGTALKMEAAVLPDLWRDLFHDWDFGRTVSIKLEGDRPTDTRFMQIARVAEGVLKLPLDDTSAPSITAPLEFFYREANGTEHRARPEYKDGNLVMPSVPSVAKATILPSLLALEPGESANRLSQISKRGDKEVFLRTLQGVFPDIEEVSSESDAGNWMPYVRLRSLRLAMPLAMYSGGSLRFVNMLLAIASSDGGIVLIDEIENGFHYTLLPQLWKALVIFAKRYQVQLFVSTHSLEALNAACSVVDEYKKEFHMIRTTRTNGASTVESIPGDKFRDALASGFEIR